LIRLQQNEKNIFPYITTVSYSKSRLHEYERTKHC